MRVSQLYCADPLGHMQWGSLRLQSKAGATPPLRCVSATIAAKTLPLPCVSAAVVAKTGATAAATVRRNACVAAVGEHLLLLVLPLFLVEARSVDCTRRGRGVSAQRQQHRKGRRGFLVLKQRLSSRKTPPFLVVRQRHHASALSPRH